METRLVDGFLGRDGRGRNRGVKYKSGTDVCYICSPFYYLLLLLPRNNYTNVIIVLKHPYNIIINVTCIKKMCFNKEKAVLFSQ